ncbi:MAG TPA: nuclear transport factor 2 family protein [Vicinamibacterales bacterium]|nr:nuclear transport factor 2 family protein [Vicinamibacterales bacterium]
MRLMAVLGAMALMTAGAAAQQKGADEAAIAKIRTAYQTAAGAQDAAGLAKLFAADGVEMPPNAPAASGRAAIEAFHKEFAKQWMLHGMTITATSTRVMGDTAYDIGTYKQQLMSHATGGMVDDKGKYVVLLKKDAAGNWAISHAIYNSDNPPPPPPAKK